jgi:hypothetical protein
MNKILRHTVAAALLCWSAVSMAQTYVLQNEYVRAGVNNITGTLGSGGNTNPGLQYDNTGTSTFNPSYDYLTPGSPFEGFTIKLDGTMYRNNNAGNFAQIAGNWVGTPSTSGAVWAGSLSGVLGLQNTYSLPSGQKYIGIQSRITVTNAVTDLYFARYIDPDARAAAGDSSSTDNVRGYSGVPGTNVIFSEALSSRYALGLYTSQLTNTNTGPSNTWSTDPSAYYTGGSYTVGRGDHTIGISFYNTGLSAGDIVTYNYAYIFGPNAFAAATVATTAYDPGATFTVADVGSATAAASAPSAPTITGTSTAVITVSDTTAVNTGLPVITASVANHNASEAAGRQTIARETTTNVTTPYTRSVVTLVRTTNTWSDSTVTTTDGATTTTNTLINDVQTTVANDSFSGRIDQMNYLTNLNKHLDRGLNMDAFRNDGVTVDDVTMYVNAIRGESSLDDGYRANSNTFGLGVEKAIEPNWRLGAQYNQVRTKMAGTDSDTAQDKKHAGLFSVYTLDNDVKIVNNLGYAENNIKSNRTVENVFNNSHSTAGDNVWLNNKIYAPETDGFRPYLGLTVGRSTTNGYQEAGSIQSQRTVGKQSNDYTFGEAGVRYEKNFDDVRLTGDLSRTTEGVASGSVTLGYSPTKNGTVALTASTQQSNNMTTNAVSLRGIIKF